VIKKAVQNGDIGIVLCDCGGTLGTRLDFDKITKQLKQMSAVAQVLCTSDLCRKGQCSKLVKSMAKKQTDRLVIGACNREVFDRELCRAAADENLNEGLLWCVNIRELCGWVTDRKKAATDKAINILNAAVRRTRLAEPVNSKKVNINQEVLVIGGGIAAMQAAVVLSELGYIVKIVTEDETLGASAAKTPELYAYLDESPSEAEKLVKAQLDALAASLLNNGKVSIATEAFVKSVDGQFGNFTITVESNGAEQASTVGAIILSTSSTEQSRLAGLINKDRDLPRRVAIVIDNTGEQDQAVTAEVFSAAQLLMERFAAEVKVYCHNVRVAAEGLERLYRQVRNKGVVFVKYESPPVILDRAARKIVRVNEPTVNCQLSEEFDLVVEANSIGQNGSSALANLISGLQKGPDGQLQADSVWLLPTKTNLEGIFAVGNARGNGEFRDSQTDGLSCANQVHELLKDKRIEVLDDAAQIDTDKCVVCLTCMRICPHGAVSIDVEKKVAAISELLCKRCGICAAQCPAGAIELPRYTDKQIAAEMADNPSLTVFACENSAYPAATLAGLSGSEYNANIRLIRVPCIGKVDSRDILKALQAGAEKVLVLGCHPENCQYLDGSSRVAKRIERINKILEKAGVDGKRVVFGPLASVEPARFLDYVKE